LSNWICNFLSEDKGKKIYDFGCGMGKYLDDLNKKGHYNLLGVEVEPPFTGYQFEIKSQNLTEFFDFGEKGAVISLEVGEHIPKQYMDTYLDNLIRHCDKFLIISWALEGQGGYGHVNELNNDKIIPIIESKGFKFLEKESLDARSDIEDNYWYFRNSILIFEKI
jgi:SAM-dependent methyltransferase